MARNLLVLCVVLLALVGADAVAGSNYHVEVMWVSVPTLPIEVGSVVYPVTCGMGVVVDGDPEPSGKETEDDPDVPEVSVSYVTVDIQCDEDYLTELDDFRVTIDGWFDGPAPLLQVGENIFYFPDNRNVGSNFSVETRTTPMAVGSFSVTITDVGVVDAGTYEPVKVRGLPVGGLEIQVVEPTPHIDVRFGSVEENGVEVEARVETVNQWCRVELWMICPDDTIQHKVRYVPPRSDSTLYFDFEYRGGGEYLLLGGLLERRGFWRWELVDWDDAHWWEYPEPKS